ncbi:MAG: lipase family protein [Holosporaceae bacterium]|nr:lipase family protein [Holosporaceae bacterium]
MNKILMILLIWVVHFPCVASFSKEEVSKIIQKISSSYKMQMSTLKDKASPFFYKSESESESEDLMAGSVFTEKNGSVIVSFHGIRKGGKERQCDARVFNGTDIGNKYVGSILSALRKSSPISFERFSGGFRLFANFGNALMDCYESMKKLIPPESEIIFAGHSTGGALAQLAALKYVTEEPSSKVRVFSLGAIPVWSREGSLCFARNVGAWNAFNVYDSGNTMIISNNFSVAGVKVALPRNIFVECAILFKGEYHILINGLTSIENYLYNYQDEDSLSIYSEKSVQQIVQRVCDNKAVAFGLVDIAKFHTQKDWRLINLGVFIDRLYFIGD